MSEPARPRTRLTTLTPARARSPSVGRLLFVAQAPLLLFAVGMTVVTLVVVAVTTTSTSEVAVAVGRDAATRGAIQQLGAGFRSIWLACMGGFYVVLALSAAVVAWSHRVLARRIERLVTFAENLGSDTPAPPIADSTHDSLGRLASSLTRVQRELSKRDQLREAESESREQLARVQRAMGWIDTEDDARRVVGRSLFALAHGTPAELLMADSSHAHLTSVVQSSTAPAPGCGVEAPAKCPAVQRGNPLTFPDSESLDACPKLHERATPCAALCIPVLVMGRSVGVLHLTRPRGTSFDPATAEALEALTAAYGTRVGTLRTLGTARLQAETDPLTGLLNRRSLEEKAAEVFKSCPMAVVAMADLDHFKRLNDLHGHGVGDKALREFALVLRSTLRPGDVVARYGGEEFTVLLLNATGEEGGRSLDRVRAALEKRCVAAGLPAVTVSFGAAEFPRHGSDLDALLKVADAALYRSKQDGRDRVTLAE
jgi:diguanylate cyclase (GGDEF)-like protein